MDTPRGGHSGESISVGRLHSTARMLSLIRGRAICDLAHYLIIFFAPSTFYLPFSSKRVNLRPTCISQYQLDCATTLDDSGRNRGGTPSMNRATRVVSAGAYPGMPRFVTCTAQKYCLSPQWRYASRDVNNNSINSAHGHQLKGTTVL